MLGCPTFCVVKGAIVIIDHVRLLVDSEVVACQLMSVSMHSGQICN